LTDETRAIADEPQEDGYYVNDVDGNTIHQLPRLRSEVAEIRQRLYDASQEWDGTVIEPTVWKVALAAGEAIKEIEAEMEKFGLSVRVTGLG